MPKHDHKLLPVNSKVVKFDGDFYTIVLMRCECGEIDDRRLAGEWTWDELTGKRTAATTDDKFLRDLKVSTE